MRLPEPLIRFMNPAIGLALKSPLHGVLSSSVLVLRFTGRRTGRQFETPLRYVRTDGGVRCFSSQETQWWKNLRQRNSAHVLVAGQWLEVETEVRQGAGPEDRHLFRELFRDFLRQFPGDAAYHGIVRRGGRISEADFERAAMNAIAVDMVQCQSG